MLFLSARRVPALLAVSTVFVLLVLQAFPSAVEAYVDENQHLSGAGGRREINGRLAPGQRGFFGDGDEYKILGGRRDYDLMPVPGQRGFFSAMLKAKGKGSGKGKHCVCTDKNGNRRPPNCLKAALDALEGDDFGFRRPCTSKDRY